MHHILLNGDFLLYYIILKRREKKEDYYICIYRAAFRLDCNRKYIHTHRTVLYVLSAARPISLFIPAGLIRVERAPTFLRPSRNSLTFMHHQKSFLFIFLIVNATHFVY